MGSTITSLGLVDWAVTLENWRDLFTAERAATLGAILLQLALILLVTRLAAFIASKAVDRYVTGYRRLASARGDPGRVQTLGTLMHSVVRYTAYFVGGVWMLDVVGISAGSVIATAGIGGIAIGFGAQHLVKDIISGFFILMEDQYEVDELVTIDGVTGTVAEVGLRSTRIQAMNGDIHYLPNGSISRVVNHSRADMSAIIDVSIGYGEDHNRAIDVANQALADFRQQVDYITDGPTVWGIQELGASGVQLRIFAKAKNGRQWELGRQMRRVIKEAFDRAGIEIPFPHQVVILRNEGGPPGEGR